MSRGRKSCGNCDYIALALQARQTHKGNANSQKKRHEQKGTRSEACLKNSAASLRYQSLSIRFRAAARVRPSVHYGTFPSEMPPVRLWETLAPPPHASPTNKPSLYLQYIGLDRSMHSMHFTLLLHRLLWFPGDGYCNVYDAHSHSHACRMQPKNRRHESPSLVEPRTQTRSQTQKPFNYFHSLNFDYKLGVVTHQFFCHLQKHWNYHCWNFSEFFA